MREHITQSNLIENVADIEEIKQSILAWDFLSYQSRLTLDNVLYTHKLIMQNILPPHDAGSFRTHGVQVGNRVCPAPQYVPELMEEWLDSMEHWEDHQPRKMHVWFERIHPFIDGNGRSGRMYFWWHEIKLGQEPTLIMYHDRWNYYDWFDTSK